MNQFTVPLLRLGLLIEQLQRGPKFIRLPPANYWHAHPNEIEVVAKKSDWAMRGGYAARNWARSTVNAHHVGFDEARNPRLDHAEVPYEYAPYDAPVRRTAQALRILESVEEIGEVCCEIRKFPNHAKRCVCVKLGSHPGEPHMCRHGETTWR